MNGTGPVEGEEEVRWKELRRQAWEGLGWKSRSGWEGRRGLRGQLQVLQSRQEVGGRRFGGVGGRWLEVD